MRILVTGASGFIGRAVTASLLRQGHHVIAPSRRLLHISHQSLQNPLIDDIEMLGAMPAWLSGCQVVIHIAAKAHLTDVSLTDYRRSNTDATLALARAASAVGCKRFIFLSSIGVNGVNNNSPFTVDDKPAPVEDYAISKLEAELALRQLAAETALQWVIIRPPLVYGPDAPGNFGKLSRLAQKNLPLPFGAIHNKRSLVALDNLVDLIITCIEHPAAANQTFLVSDDNDVSTTQLLQLMSRAAGKKPRLLPVPVSWLRFAAKLTGKQTIIDRLCGNLQVDITHTKKTLGWVPPITVEEGVLRCFLKEELC
ncbi:MAG TPA: SDR family oxidoreductase [Rheinheimera sp.]|nr:SDR family oxidoreductase [Rheinheimera sp.]